MKIPKARKLESGKWFIQVMTGKKREGKTFDTEKEAVAWAAAIKAKTKQQTRNPANMELKEAINRYIESKDAVLSPSTIAGYQKLKRNMFPELMEKKLSSLTQESIQKAVNQMARDKSPKYVKNAHGLLSAVLGEYYPNFQLKTTLPQKTRYEIAIPTEEDIIKVYQAIKGNELELPFLLAVWLGLRASEISGLTWDCINGNMLHIKQARVRAEDGWTLKKTKTYKGNRKLRLPAYIQSLIEQQPKRNEYIIQLSGQAMYERFSRVCARIGVPHYRFHDLRHVNASVMLSLSVPDKYAMERMGHSGNQMLKTVYQHTMTHKQIEVADAVDNYFFEKLHI